MEFWSLTPREFDALVDRHVQRQRVDDLRAAMMPFHYMVAHAKNPSSISIDEFCVATGAQKSESDDSQILKNFLGMGAIVKHAEHK